MSNTLSDPEYVLRGVTGMVFGRSYHLLAPTTIGRSPECDIHLDSSGISRVHARLRPLDYGIEVEDLKSTNGSFLNGQRIGIGIARVGDEIAFDQLRFRIMEVRQPRQATNAAVQGNRERRRWPWLAVALAVAAGAVAIYATR
ncbi:FHA domain-containing protein [Lysobacter niabensis]|uniref:FHA domain-containing protein n=1 Tax=Agrilutibacter niabensis TaxID=380628 RepID=UPI0036110D37